MNHKAGDKMYVDYSGKILSIIAKKTALNSHQAFVKINHHSK